MTLAEIRRKYEEKISKEFNQMKKELWEKSPKFDGSNYTFAKWSASQFGEISVTSKNNEYGFREKKGKTKFLSMMSNHFELHNHIIVHFQYTYAYRRDENKPRSIESKKIEYYLKFYEEIKNYWREYAVRKNKDGFILVAYAPDLHPFFFDAILSKESRQEEIELDEFIKKCFNRNDWIILNTNSFTGLEHKIRSFKKISHLLHDILKKNPLLTTKVKYAESMFFRPIGFHYAGTEFKMVSSQNFQKIKIIFEDKKEQNIDVTKEDLDSLLQQIKEENKMKNLIDRPIFNFKKLITHVTKMYSFEEEITEREFDKLQEEMGSWEAVEAWASTMKETHLINDVAKTLVKTKGEGRKNDVFVYRIHDKKKYYFIIAQEYHIIGEYKTDKTFYIYSCDEKEPTNDIKLKISECILKKV